MMIRSTPPASAHLALSPVPAPPPMTGRPAATWARRRRRHSSRVKKLMAAPSGAAPRRVQSSPPGRPAIVSVVAALEESVMAVLLIGTLDTKGVEAGFVRDLL